LENSFYFISFEGCFVLVVHKMMTVQRVDSVLALYIRIHRPFLKSA